MKTFDYLNVMLCSLFCDENVECNATSDGQGLGKGENLTGETFTLFTNYFGAPTFNDEYVAEVRWIG